MEVQRSWLYMCCACVIATWRLGLQTPLVSANWKKKRTHQKNCLLHHELFVVWLDGVQEDIEPKWYQPLWCHDPEKNRRNIWFNIGGEFKARWMKKRERWFFSQWHRRLRGKNPSTPFHRTSSLWRCWLVGARMVVMVTSKGMLCFKLLRLVSRKARKLFGSEGKSYCQDRLNSRTVPSSQTSQFCFVNW